MEYNVEQVSEMLDVCSETVRRWIRDNKLKATLKNKRYGYRIDESSLDEFKQRYSKYQTVDEDEPTDLPTLDICLKLIMIQAAEIDKLVAKVDELLDSL